jgi:HEAT repeat protein
MSDLDRLLAAIAADDGWARHQALERLRAEGAEPSRIRGLRDDLAAADASRRAAARMALAALAGPGTPAERPALDTLADALHDPDTDLRVLAASALGETGNPEAGALLIDALEDPEPNVVAAAADGLGELGQPRALRSLAALTRSSELWLRAAAVVALGRLRDERAIPDLAEAAKEPGLEAPLVEAIARIGHPDGLGALRTIRKTAPESALLAAGGILCAHPDVEAPAWVMEGARARESVFRDRTVREDDPAAARLLGLAGTREAVRTLLELVGPPRRSEAAITGLLASPADLRHDAILERLATADGPEKVVLLSLLPPARTGERIRPLVPLLDDPDDDVRAATAEALARAPAAAALPFLVAELDREGVAPEVVRALGNLGPAACGALAPLLRDPSSAVRSATALALARCADAGIVEPVRRAYEAETEPEVRHALLRTLGRAGGSDMVRLLAEAAVSGDRAERIAAIEGLGLTESPDAVPPLAAALDRSPAETQAALRALGDIGEERAAEVIAGCLTADDVETRRAAARAAARATVLPGPAPIARLARDDDGWVRLFAVRLLARSGARSEIRRLVESDPQAEVREEAREALRKS